MAKKDKTLIRVKWTDKLYRFISIYKLTKTWKKALIVVASSLITAVVAVLLVQNTGLYIPGLEALSQGIAKISFFAMIRDGYSVELSYSIYTILFWVIYFIINVPLIVWSWFKISKEFSYLSCIYIFFNTLFAIGFSMIPNIQDIFIFSKINAPVMENVDKYSLLFVSWTRDKDAIKQVSLFIYAFLWGTYQAINYSILLILNGSTGGLDFVGVYTAKTKYKDFGTSLNFFNIIFFLVGYFLGTYIPVSEVLRTTAGASAQYGTSAYAIDILLSPNFIAVITMAFIFSVILNSLFPKYSLVRVEIYTTHAAEIRKHIVEEKKPYTLTIYEAKGGYNYKSQTVLVTSCMYLNTDDLLSIVRQYDQDAFFSITKIKKVDGYLYMYKD